MTVESATIHPAMAAAIEALDVPRLKTDFENQNEFVVIENFLPFAVLEKLLSDLQGLLSCVHRNYIPTYKKGGSVGRQNIDRFSPTFGQLYNDPALLKFFNHLTGDHLMDCPSDDPHTYALYCYTEPDDHVGFHYDTSYYRGKRYTVLVGLVDNSSCRLVCQLHRDDPDRETQTISLALQPRTFVIFNGDNLYHKVTPLGKGETRIALTMEYVTDRSMSPLGRLVSNVKDALGYFGFHNVFMDSKTKK